MGYARSPFREFESYLRLVVGLEEEDIQLLMKENISDFVSFKITTGIYAIKDISAAVYTHIDHEATLQIEHGDITVKTKLILTRFGGNFGKLRFNQKIHFKHFVWFYTILGF